MPRSPADEALHAWAWLLRTSPRTARCRHFRGRWVRIAAKRCGRAVGSLQQRVLYL